MAAEGPLRRGGQGLTLALRVQPGAGRDEILGAVADSAGALALKVKVSAPPEDGRANAAVLALLAKALGLPRSALTLVKGERDRNKVVALAGDPDELEAKIAARLAERPVERSAERSAKRSAKRSG